MPKQEIFFKETVGACRVEVLKSYDQNYAQEAFNSMDEEARTRLWEALKPEETYDPAGLSKLNDPDDVNDEAGAFLRDELVEQALEDPRASPRSTSFFIVNETVEGTAKTSSSHRIGQVLKPSQRSGSRIECRQLQVEHGG